MTTTCLEMQGIYFPRTSSFSPPSIVTSQSLTLTKIPLPNNKKRDVTSGPEPRDPYILRHARGSCTNHRNPAVNGAARAQARPTVPFRRCLLCGAAKWRILLSGRNSVNNGHLGGALRGDMPPSGGYFTQRKPPLRQAAWDCKTSATLINHAAHSANRHCFCSSLRDIIQRYTKVASQIFIDSAYVRVGLWRIP